jgi:oligopeptide/dipeptide ABC transporter ATP-binding protein
MTRALELDQMRVEIRRGDATITPVDGVSLEVDEGECLGVVGESGCGKSLTLKAAIGLLPPGARLAGGQVRLATGGDGVSVTAPGNVRGNGIAMVFQEPMTALNPTKRVGRLIAEGVRLHRPQSRSSTREQVLRLMQEVGIPDPEHRVRAWPHELSGGLRQRVMIAMALSCEPRVLLCDEPTTALDVTIQDQILALLNRLREQRGLAVVFVTHDLAVLGEIAHRVAVMYAGKVVEQGTTDEIFAAPRHPYTWVLLHSVPSLDGPRGPLASIGGTPPDPGSYPVGCRFAPRCKFVQADCVSVTGELLTISDTRRTACIHSSVLAQDRDAVT